MQKQGIQSENGALHSMCQPGRPGLSTCALWVAVFMQSSTVWVLDVTISHLRFLHSLLKGEDQEDYLQPRMQSSGSKPLASKPPWRIPGRLWRFRRLPKYKILWSLFHISHLCQVTALLHSERSAFDILIRLCHPLYFFICSHLFMSFSIALPSSRVWWAQFACGFSCRGRHASTRAPASLPSKLHLQPIQRQAAAVRRLTQWKSIKYQQHIADP